MEQETINSIKILGLDMIQKAKSGHPGITLGAAPILYTLYARHMNIYVADPYWPNRDRFVLSAGHGSALLYATLFFSGYSLTMEDLKQFRRAGSKTPGHPEYGTTPGVDMTTGPLGQGFAAAVGLAISEKKLRQELLLPQTSIVFERKSMIDHYIYVLCGDGDMMEGVTSEAASLAGALELSHLIVLYDSNDITLDGNVSSVMKENVRAKFEAMGWATELVKDGTDVNAIDKAITKAKKNNKPTLIEVKTILGQGSNYAGTSTVHGGILEKEDYEQIRYSLGFSKEPFQYSVQAKEKLAKQIQDRSRSKYSEWAKHYQMFMEGKSGKKVSDYQFLFGKETPLNLMNHEFYFPADLRESTKTTNRTVMKEIANMMPHFLGGSADMMRSTNTYLDTYQPITAQDFSGRMINFGVREHAMGAIINGMTLDRYRVFGSTMLAFSDYLKPAIRMSAMMHLPVLYVFTHDTVSIGQDGPTHQPVEQLATLRAIPNVYVYRPADAHELVGCWHMMLQSKSAPSLLVLSKIEVELMASSSAKNVAYGGYIIQKEQGQLHGILISTGSEISIALHVAEDLEKEMGVHLRVVSMPCRELFLLQTKEYRESVLPKGCKTFVIEAGSKLGWEGFVYNDDYLCTIDSFGVSGTKEEVLRAVQFDYPTIKSRIASKY